MARRRPLQNSERKPIPIPLIFLGVGGIATLALAIGIILSVQRPPATLSAGVKRAAIVDQVALTFPNPAFIAEAQDILRRAGYEVDTYAAKDVTIDFYRSLPSRGYKLVLIRSHATNLYNGAPGGPDALFTSEPYDKQRYPIEQITDQIASARVVYGDDPTRYFSIMANFVRRSMSGRFDRSLIILGGCQTLATGDLAQALLEKGAAAVVGWNEMVTLPHNDEALLALLKNIAAAQQPLELAVARTMAAVGPDPRYGSSLTLRPQ